MKILSFGSLNYDYTYEVEHFLAPKETLAAKSMQWGFGGKGANQSIAFARAGLSVYHAGRVGADGQPFVDYLKQNGIHTDYLIKDDAAATGHAIIEVCRGENCILIYGGANQEITTEQIDHTLKAFSPGDWLVLQNEISNLPYLMQAAQKKGLSIFFNGGHRRHGFWHSKLSAQPQPESASGSGAAPSGFPPDPGAPGCAGHRWRFAGV